MLQVTLVYSTAHVKLTNIPQAALLLATTATFITTQPPKMEIIDYTQRGPYICLLTSFALLLFGVIVGSAAQFVISSCTPVLVRNVRTYSVKCSPFYDH